MNEYRIKEIIHTKFVNGIAKKEYTYMVQYKKLFGWKNYVFTECDRKSHDSLLSMSENKYFHTEKEASDAVDRIKNLYVGGYKGYDIIQTYNGAYISNQLGYRNSYHDSYYYVYESLKEIQDAIDTITCKDKVRYIK